MADDGGQGPPGAFHIYSDASSQRLANYRDLLRNSAPFCTGKTSGPIVAECRAALQLLFDSHRGPVECRRPIAEYFLAGPALLFWNMMKEEFGPDPSMDDLFMALSQQFLGVTDAQRWDELASGFR